MTDLSTLAGQAEHYQAVRKRLFGRAPGTQPAAPLSEAEPSSPAPDFRYRPGNTDFVDLLRPPSWVTIVELTALKFGVTVADILGPSRVSRYTLPRQHAMFLVATHIDGISLPRVARRFNRDHTTALHAVRKIASARGDEWEEDAWRPIGAAGRTIIERLTARLNGETPHA